MRSWNQFAAARRAERRDDKPKELKILRDGKPLTFSLPAGTGKLGVLNEDRVVPQVKGQG